MIATKNYLRNLIFKQIKEMIEFILCWLNDFLSHVGFRQRFTHINYKIRYKNCVFVLFCFVFHDFQVSRYLVIYLNAVELLRNNIKIENDVLSRICRTFNLKNKIYLCALLTTLYKIIKFSSTYLPYCLMLFLLSMIDSLKKYFLMPGR